ncbi:MAG TPA: [FeFe] hydrogenase H-cluster radical SAM maturase HydG, partial [Candidatus Cloacimonadota bacterium]|nr:[FeFe] hydrogenase H-cluster radical SAM maturase HydG [Candidatus Cloacimonadota bacterium]
TPNALLTFAEYLYDFSSARTLQAGLELIEREAALIEDAGMQASVRSKLAEMKAGSRDLYY